MFVCPKGTFAAANATEMFGKNSDQPHIDDPGQSPEPRIRKIKWNLCEQLLKPQRLRISIPFVSSHPVLIPPPRFVYQDWLEPHGT